MSLVLGELKLEFFQEAQNKATQPASRVRGVRQSAVLGALNDVSVMAEGLNYSTSNEKSIFAGS